MAIIRGLIETDIAQWIHAKMRERLTGRSLNCGINAWNFLIRADHLAPKIQTVAFFCVTHAVEEAVAAFVFSAKSHGYDTAKAINIKDHNHKAIIQEFARMVADDAGSVKLGIALKADQDALIARFMRDGKQDYHPLWLGLLSYNPTPEDTHWTCPTFVESV